MKNFDIIFKNGKTVTENGVEDCDIAVSDGKICDLGKINAEAKIVEDVSNLLVLPGGIDAHVHIDQPSGPDVEMADNFQSATKSAAAGGNTTVLPFAMQEKDNPLENVENYHKKANGNLFVDTSFHLIISDPSPQVLGQELPALARDGYTSFKVFMTYDDLVLNDEELLKVFEVAKNEKTLVMVMLKDMMLLDF